MIRNNNAGSLLDKTHGQPDRPQAPTGRRAPQLVERLVQDAGAGHQHYRRAREHSCALLRDRLASSPTVSSQFCDQHHRLLFKILETSKEPNICSNIVIALGVAGSQEENAYNANAFDLQWDDQGEGTVGESVLRIVDLAKIFFYQTFDKGGCSLQQICRMAGLTHLCILRGTFQSTMKYIFSFSRKVRS